MADQVERKRVIVRAIVGAGVGLTALGIFPLHSLAQDDSAVPLKNRDSAQSAVDDADTDEVLNRLMQYEQRILKLEKKEAPSEFVPEGDPVSRDRGGEGTGEIFYDRGVAATTSASLKDLSNQKAALEQRVGELENSLKASQDLVSELKKVRPSSAELGALQTQVSERDREIKRLQDRVAELERSSKLPRLREDDAVAAATQAAENIRILKLENSKMLDQLAKFKQQINDLTNQLDASGVKQDQLIKQAAVYKAESEQASSALKTAKKSLEGQTATAQENVKLQSLVTDLKSELESTKGELNKRKEAESSASALKKANDDLKVRITELEEQAKGKSALQSKLDKALAETQDGVKLREQLTKERDELLATTNQLRQDLAKLKDDRSGSQARLESLESEVKLRDTDIAESNRQLSKAIQDTKQCSEQLTAATEKAARVTEVENALIKAKNDLLLKETEVRMLSGGGSKAAVGLDTPPAFTEPKTTPSSRPSLDDLASRITPIDKSVSTESAKSDVLVVEVTAKKVNLRSGPGNEHAPVMQVQTGTQLTVEAKEGEWFRVLTPTGSRAYIRSDVVKEPGAATPGAAPAKPVARRPVADDDDADLVPFKLDNAPKKGDSVGNGDDEDTRAFESLKSAIQHPVPK